MKVLYKISFWLLLAISLASCNSQSIDSIPERREEIISLNGNWKFNTFLGEGSNYLDVTPKQSDIIIDNSEKSFLEIEGKWKTRTIADRGTTFWGKNYLAHNYKKNNDPASVKFKSKVPKTGYYEHFIHYPAGSHMAALISVKHADGVYVKDYNQKTRPSVWLSLGIYKVEKGGDHYIKFSAVRKGELNADAILLRPINKEEYEKVLTEKQQITLSDYDDSNWGELKVPGHFGMINKYSNYTGKAWYRKALNLPENWKQNEGERLRVRFEGVYHVARVFLNGEYLGRHQGGFTPFEFDITDKINEASKNILVVEADNDYLVGATWNWGGIIREVSLIKTNQVRVKYQYIHAEPNLEEGTANYQVKIRIENNGAQEKTLEILTGIQKESPLTNTATKVTIAANSIKEIEVKGKLEAKDVKLWHFDKPELYQIKTSVLEKGVVLHTKIDRFGIRKFEATPTQMLLNGEPVRLVGFNRVSDHRYWGSSEPQELINLDVDLMKTAGANFTRIMHGTQNKKLLERCDEKGILLFEEANIRDLRMPEIYEEDYKYPKQWIKEMIERDANHPSIVGWSVGNELEDHFDYVKMTYEYAKKLDPHRLALHVSNRGYRKGESPKNNPLEYGDMIFQNIYQKNPGGVMDTLHKRWPNKAMFFSEFGVGRFTTPSLDNDVSGLGVWYDNMRNQRLYTTGASVWTYNDYKSGYSQTLAEENRAWGMVNAWRKKRRSFYTHQKQNSPITNLKVEEIDLNKRKAHISFKIRGKEDFPSYTMRDYTLQYSFKDANGVELLKGKKDLPVLRPGMGSWSGNISWEEYKGKPSMLSTTLVATNGYVKRETLTYFEVPSQPIIDEVKTSGNKIRVHFTKKHNAFEYYLKYKINGKDIKSFKTIANYIDLDSLPTKALVNLELIAVNKKGESKASKTEKIKVEGKQLAPIVWDKFIADKKLVVGYSGDFEDVNYTIRYGANKMGLINKEKSNSRGMMTIPLGSEEPVYFQIKRETAAGESQWSNVLYAKEGAVDVIKN